MQGSPATRSAPGPSSTYAFSSRNSGLTRMRCKRYKRARPAPPRLLVAMQSMAIWTPLREGLAQRPVPPTACLPPGRPMQPQPTPTGPAMALNAPFMALNTPFGEEEVRGGLRLLCSDRSAGNTGLTA